MIQKAFGDGAMTAAQVIVWHKCFKDGQESVESDPRSGRPAASKTPENVEHVWAAISKGWRQWRTRSSSGDSKKLLYLRF